MVRAISRVALGAWLLKCNPTLRESGRLAGSHIDSWCVAGNYRSSMMVSGDRIGFWLSGSVRSLPRGIWGIGHVAGPAVASSAEGTGSSLRLPVDIELATTPVITDAEMRALGIDDLEVQRMPQGSNPSWISRPQLRRLGPLLGPWADGPDSR